jgi:hypothetical protein
MEAWSGGFQSLSLVQMFVGLPGHPRMGSFFAARAALPFKNIAGKVYAEEFFGDDRIYIEVLASNAHEDVANHVTELVGMYCRAVTYGHMTWEDLSALILEENDFDITRKIQMIKEFKDRTGCGLRDAKSQIELAINRVKPGYADVVRIVNDLRDGRLKDSSGAAVTDMIMSVIRNSTPSK